MTTESEALNTATQCKGKWVDYTDWNNGHPHTAISDNNNFDVISNEVPEEDYELIIDSDGS